MCDEYTCVENVMCDEYACVENVMCDEYSACQRNCVENAGSQTYALKAEEYQKVNLAI